MVFPGYLAMTAQEFQQCRVLPDSVAWMACRFSTTGKGLVNLPERLPKNSLILLTDQVSPTDHDPQIIAHTLLDLAAAWNIGGVILDFQKEYDPKCAKIAEKLQETLPCPVALTPPYRDMGTGPILLPPIPPDCSASSHLQPWQNREIWLETDLDGCQLVLTDSGCLRKPLENPLTEPIFYHADIFCHYHIRLSPTQAEFSLQRTREDLESLLVQAAAMGVTKTIGLFQQFYSAGLYHSV